MNEDFVPYELLCKLREKGYKCKDKRFEGHIYDMLKWLREEKKIHVWININFDMTWFWDIWGISKEPDCLGESDGTYQSYELAALDGIKYCLDNLI